MKNPIRRIYIRLPNWIGDVCMTLPCLDAVIATQCEVIICAKPWAKDLLSGLHFTAFIPLTGKWLHDRKTLIAYQKAHPIEGKSVGLLLPDSLSSALTFRTAGIQCAGYRDDGRSPLLKWAINKPSQSLHAVESWYYLCHTALTIWGFSSKSPVDHQLHLPLHSQHIEQAEQIRSQIPSSSFIMIAPTATGKHKGREKIWPYFDTLTRQLQNEGYTVVMSPPPNEKEMALQQAPTAMLLPPMSLGTFVALLGKASMVICNDSGVSHLASIGAKHQITLIGVTDPQRTRPWSPTAVVLGKMDAWPSVQDVINQIKKII
ncbi:heptosyltransferase [Pelistega sp. NLN82]|uniref:Heptosyltransferase n=1 Tax=Pelistega ratti TaxID=2652177 RepID=A0A6L9Y3Y1_9BURK|nr:glycosyltransferase family 9 protein [Pelistega ratti]NEN74936.1 heptosyltransferase [Pelistega ratti]